MGESEFKTSELSFQTAVGNYRATHEKNIIRIKNIRYARSARYGFPELMDSAQQAVKTPVCPQNISSLVSEMVEEINIDDFEITENCQYLTISKPDNLIQLQPVIIWIHGGSYEIGCGTVPTSDPALWVKEQNVVFVTVTYRLGMFGFLGGYDDRPANLGFYDVLTAIKWVKKYIADFGGDPKNITLLGQSSGGDLIANLLSLKGSVGLFQKAIIHSAPLGLRKHRAKMSAYYSAKTKAFKNENDVFKMMKKQHLMAPPISLFGLKAAMPFGVQYGFPPFDQEKNMEQRWRENAKYFDVLIGFNEDEAAFYLKHPQKKSGWANHLLIRYATNWIYGRSIRRFAKSYQKAGGNIDLFCIQSQPFHSHFGAAHCIGLALLFSEKKAWAKSALIADISYDFIFDNGKKLRNLWSDFARSGSLKVPKNWSLLKVFKP